jgi:PAS domain S-box-containing protein
MPRVDRTVVLRVVTDAGLALAAFGFAAFQSQFPITLGPDWIHLTPLGIGFTAAVLHGFRVIFPLGVGAVLFHLVAGTPLAAAVSGLTGFVAGTLVAGWLARRQLPFTAEFDYPRDVLRFALVALAAVAVRGSVVGIVSAMLGLAKPIEAGFGSAVIDWLTIVILCPAVLVWWRGEWPIHVTKGRLAEAIFVGGMVACLTWVWYGSPSARPLSHSISTVAILVVFGNWVALRFHTRGMVTLVSVVTGVIVGGAILRGTFDPVIRLADNPPEQWATLNGLGIVVLLNLLVAAVARGNHLREAEREDLIKATQKQAARLKELNERMSLQTLEIADQAAEMQRQRDAFESLARELADKQAWLETVLTQLPVGVMLGDAEKRIITWNAVLSSYMGFPGNINFQSFDEFRDWPVETPDGQILPWEEWPLSLALKNGETVHQRELRMGRYDGGWVQLAISAAPILGAKGNILGAILALTDLTPIRRTEERLRLLESAVVHARDAVIVLEPVANSDRGRAVLYVNDAFTTITGYTRDEAIGRSLHFLRGPNTDPTTLNELRTALETGFAFKGELLNYRKDGSQVWVDVSLVPVIGPEGRCIHFVMIQRDITGRKRTEEALRQSEAMFRGFFESTAAGVSLTGADGRFVSCNPAFAAQIGVPIAEVIGRHPVEFTHPDDCAEQEALLNELLSGTRNNYQIQKRYVRPDESVVWVELSVTAVRNSSGELLYGLGVSVDVTSRRKLEEQLQQVQKMEALGQLAGGVAHDFNNLLTAVLGNLALVQLSADDPNRPLVRTAEQAAARAADLTRKLLGYARRNQLLVSPLKPADVIEEVVDIVYRTLDPRIEIVADVRTDAEVLADATLLNQALINLCLNARDAMPHGGRLTLAADAVTVCSNVAAQFPEGRPGEFIRFSVTDTGEGMTDSVLRRLFEPFFTTKGVGRGTGLGLPMVHGIMRQHGGWVAVESEPGNGAKFELYLPAAGAGQRQTGPTPPPRLAASASLWTSDHPPKTGTILLVDDETMIRQLGRAVLESAGYTVLEAEDGAIAMEIFREQHAQIDLVILDLTMPRLSGRDVFRQIQAIDPAARVLFSSGYSADDLSELDGAKGLLSKPYRPPDLLMAVCQAIADATEPLVTGAKDS